MAVMSDNILRNSSLIVYTTLFYELNVVFQIAKSDGDVVRKSKENTELHVGIKLSKEKHNLPHKIKIIKV